MSQYEVVVGIETHVQLATKSKLFCACNNDSREAEPNTHVCPVCLGMPGALPVLNGGAVKLALKAGLALNAYAKTEAIRTKFERKNYFYPDSPMNYQITQLEQPIIGQGYVEVPFGTDTKRVGITRAQLEADAGKLIHPPGVNYSLVDLNRAGTPLLEIVSEPDIRSPAEAKAYAIELYNLMRFANISDANLYYGNMRFDVNVSLRPMGSTVLGTRTESKNLNSFRAVSGVVEYETKRQTGILDDAGCIVQETRGWDENKGVTFSQRSKEEAHDYRYFPEPDIPPLVISSAMLAAAKGDMPEYLPGDMRQALRQASAAEAVIEAAVAEPLVGRLLLAAGESKHIGNWIVGLDEEQQSKLYQLLQVQASFESLVQSLLETERMISSGDLSSTNAKLVVAELVEGRNNPAKIAQQKNLIQVSDLGTIEKIVDEVIAANPKPVESYKGGEQKVLGFLVGQVMKASRGQANPPMVNGILKRKLGG